MNREQLEQLTVNKFRAVARQLGVDPNGTQDQLVDHFIDHFNRVG